MNRKFQITGKAIYGEELEPMIAEREVDVLILDISVPNSADDHNPYPVLHIIPGLLKNYFPLNILIISMSNQHSLIDALVNIGISGYLFKGDQATIQKLEKIVEIIANGGIYSSQDACRNMNEDLVEYLLTQGQL
jgi:DNA-binding NarL/FixJ family response regulator